MTDVMKKCSQPNHGAETRNHAVRNRSSPMKQSLVRVAAFRRDHPRGWTFACTVLLAGLSLLTSLATYAGIWKPLNTQSKLGPNVGIGPSNP